MSNAFNIFDSPDILPANQTTAWSGEDLCKIREPHEPHKWEIVYSHYGLVEYICPGFATSTTVPTDTEPQPDILNEENADD